MFTGIIENLGEIQAILENKTNKQFYIKAPFFDEIKVDQSIAHNGVCLTVDNLEKENSPYPYSYSVTAIEETLNRTNLNNWKVGDLVNLERCLKAESRLDGHFVQGHVDCIATIRSIENKFGSWYYYFNIDESNKNLIVEKGSITVNGVSLTIVEADNNGFSVAIIPYTYENTNFKNFKIGLSVNIEFDILGKYINRILKNQIP